MLDMLQPQNEHVGPSLQSRRKGSLNCQHSRHIFQGALITFTFCFQPSYPLFKVRQE